jgi:glutamyl-tRNA synthetase
MDVRKVARKWAIYCRYKYDKVDFKSVVAKVVAEIPEVKKQVKEIIPEIREIVDQVSQISKNEAEEVLSREFPKL